MVSFTPRYRRIVWETEMSDANREERLQVMLTQAELAALDDWRFARRMPSRAAAIRELLKLGLAAEAGPKHLGRTRSTDFGVTMDEPGRSLGASD
jgi:hypothetical protein